MPQNYTGDATGLAAGANVVISEPVGGDAPNAASVNTPLEKLADWLQFWSLNGSTKQSYYYRHWTPNAAMTQAGQAPLSTVFGGLTPVSGGQGADLVAGTDNYRIQVATAGYYRAIACIVWTTAVANGIIYAQAGLRAGGGSIAYPTRSYRNIGRIDLSGAAGDTGAVHTETLYEGLSVNDEFEVALGAEVGGVGVQVTVQRVSLMVERIRI